MSNLIRASELQAQLGDPSPAIPGLAIIDARFDLQDPNRGKSEFEKGHIPGAVFFDLDEDLSSPAQTHGGRHPLPDTDTFARTLGQAGIGNDSTVVVYDDSAGVFAGRVWWLLKYMGHDNVRLLDGGFQAWQQAGYGVVTEPDTPTPKTFTPHLRPEMVADIALVKRTLGDANTVLIDARTAERYRGENETIDRKAGHIPGALNRPFTGNLEHNTFKSADALKTHYAAAAGKDVIVYCGSGVSAAHDLLALEEAGITGAKLYVGSWSDWSSYDDNPVATSENE